MNSGIQYCTIFNYKLCDVVLFALLTTQVDRLNSTISCGITVLINISFA